MIRQIKKRFESLNIPVYVSFSVFALLIGIAAGFSAVLFHNSIEFFNEIFFHQTREGFFFLGSAAVIIIPAIGMFLQGMMINFSKNIANKKGVGEVIKAVTIRGGLIPFRITVFNFFASVICIGSGGTLGPEGPAAQLGGGVASKIGSVLNISDERRRIFTAAGAGAAIAAIFNTPLGGVFFAIEIILLNDFHSLTFSALIIASVAASAISRVLLGNTSIFAFEIMQNFDYSKIYIYVIIGIVCGFVSTYFIQFSDIVKTFFKSKFETKSQKPQIMWMVLVGLCVGLCGLYYKEIFGIGYSGINSILKHELSLTTVIILLVMKFILVPFIYYSGGFGGFFAPALFIGACTGFIIEFGLKYFFNIHVADDTIILVSMGAMLGGMNSIPIASILIIFEMTQNYNFILPLMLSVIICSMFVQIRLRKSIHIKNLESEGFKISEQANNILKNYRVSDLKLKPFSTIDENTMLPQVISILTENNQENCLFVKNERDEIIGYISENELRPIIAEFENLKLILVAKDISNSNFKFVNLNDDLDSVMNLFSKNTFDAVPVVNPESPKEILGVISKDEIIKHYSKASLKENMVDGFGKELKTISKSSPSKVSDEFSIIEIDAPNSFVGKSLAELKLRNLYGVEVLMVKHKSYVGEVETEIKIPNPNTKLKKGDSIVLFGKDENLEKIKEI